ncbi:unnamed protein product [Adineta ricciae]|uniref:Uncharacterized protein n=1 Tax=Adineta ricciae TaxID=249248 RepID=A0A816EG13_ADIRI|nr:unnamed protein product [Adineta ricciae]
MSSRRPISAPRPYVARARPVIARPVVGVGPGIGAGLDGALGAIGGTLGCLLCLSAIGLLGLFACTIALAAYTSKI